MHKLNGIAIAVLKDEDEILYSIPRRKFNYIRAKNIKHINHCTKQLVYEFYYDGQYFYCFTLHAGHLLIVKKNKLDETVIKMLGRVRVKLDNGIQVCYSNIMLVNKERELAESLASLEQTQQYKDRFLANMSHEIRTPLNAILGFVEQLHESPLSTEQCNQVSIIKESSQTLLGVINDILDFSKVESGNIDIDPSVVNIKQTLWTSIELFKSRASEKNILLTYHASKHIDTLVYADKVRIKQVLNNLFSNAINKFTHAGGNISVSMEVIEDTPTTLGMYFSVADTGVGIADKQKEIIFNPFLNLIDQYIVSTEEQG